MLIRTEILLDHIIWISAIKDNLSNEKVDHHIMFGGHRRKPKINPKVKKLCAFFLENRIGTYLISERFRIVAKRNGLDDIYDSFIKAIRETPEYPNTFLGHSRIQEEAFDYFLSHQYENIPTKEFHKIVILFIKDVISWNEKNVRLENLAESLWYLDFTDFEINLIFQDLPSKSVFPRIKNPFMKIRITKKHISRYLPILLIFLIFITWILNILPFEIKSTLAVLGVAISVVLGLYNYFTKND